VTRFDLYLALSGPCVIAHEKHFIVPKEHLAELAQEAKAKGQETTQEQRAAVQ
jgi:hypothetical protein